MNNKGEIFNTEVQLEGVLESEPTIIGIIQDTSASIDVQIMEVDFGGLQGEIKNLQLKII